MDELTFAARRASAAPARAEASVDEESRFRTLVQSPLRAGLLRFLSASPQETFDSDILMATFGRMRLDVDNCLKELVDAGVARRIDGAPPRYTARRPDSPVLTRLLDGFLERRAAISTEDEAPSVSASGK